MNKFEHLKEAVETAAKDMNWSRKNIGLLYFHARRLGVENFINIWQRVSTDTDNDKIRNRGAIFNKALRATPTPVKGGAR